MRGNLVLLLLAATLGSARADDDEPPITFHKGQFGVSARVGVGARAIVTYENTVYCGKTDPAAENGFASVCTGRMPVRLQMEAAYGVAKSVEVTLELGIGIESDFGTAPGSGGPHAAYLAPGARFFFSEAKHTKLFVQPEVMLDFSDYPQRSGNDYGVRGIEGFWIDLHRSYGLYFYIAETLGFSRWVSATFEGGIGFQGRYP